MNIHYEFMKFIYTSCEQKGISRAELARRVGVHKSDISRYDKPMSKGLGINTAYLICLAAETTFLEFSAHLLELRIPKKVDKKVDSKKKAK